MGRGFSIEWMDMQGIYFTKNRHYSLFLINAYGAYVKREIGVTQFSRGI